MFFLSVFRILSNHESKKKESEFPEKATNFKQAALSLAFQFRAQIIAG